jgi:HEAT repeat protein
MENQTVVVPHIEDNIPIPKSAREALPNLSPQEELEARTSTIKMLADIQDENIEPSQDNMEEAEILAEEMMSNPELKPDFGNYPNETIAYLAGMVAQTSHMVAKDLADIKLTVLNGLLQEATMAKSSRERIAALKAVGEIDGVDAFKKKTEITHINKSGDELEKELMKTINELRGKVVRTTEIIDVEDIEVDDD